MPQARQVHFASAMLLIATAAWAASFTLAKDAGHALNVLSGSPDDAFFGPTMLQGVRFLLAAVLFFAILPAARNGWTRLGAARALMAGSLLGIGIILQHLALNLITPAATAFLTAMTILWVPLIQCIYKRKLPATPLLLAIALAAVGLYLLLGTGLTALHAGELLGLGCSVIFAFHLLAVSHVVRLENAWRMTAGQFAVAGLICLIPAYASHPLSPTSILPLILHANVLYPLLVILALPTFVAFTLMSLYQPKVDPTRAALIYQAEPAFAAALDFALKGRGLLPIELLGCAFILAANLTAELLPALKSERAED